MSKVKIAALNGSQPVIDEAELGKLDNALKGEILRQGDEGYDQSRTLWNAMIDRKPAVIARCMSPDDVMHAVRFGREHQLLTAVRGAGHNIAGNAVCDGGLVVDLSSMKSVRIDPKAQLAQVEPGATLGDFDKAAQEHGLVTPLGINSTTGVAGLTLGGGFGWLSRKYGMTVDNLSSADVVTADGKMLKANQKENPDLFWAIRGGGGNFGVVTRFEYRLHQLNHDVLCGLVVFPLKEAKTVLTKYREFVKTLPEETSVWIVLRKAPPLPFIPQEFHGKEIVAFAVFHGGDPEQGKKILQPIWNFGTVLGEHVGVQPYAAWQQAFDPLLTPGARNYWKSHNFIELKDETIDVAIKYASQLPSPHCEIFFALLGGAINRVAKDATAYAHRDIQFVLNVHGRWEAESEDQRCIAWSRDFFRETAPFATGGVYVNFMTEEETARVNSAYGPGFDRLVQAKRKYDPENLFRLNQNIIPNR